MPKTHNYIQKRTLMSFSIPWNVTSVFHGICFQFHVMYSMENHSSIPVFHVIPVFYSNIPHSVFSRWPFWASCFIFASLLVLVCCALQLRQSGNNNALFGHDLADSLDTPWGLLTGYLIVYWNINEKQEWKLCFRTLALSPPEGTYSPTVFIENCEFFRG